MLVITDYGLCVSRTIKICKTTDYVIVITFLLERSLCVNKTTNFCKIIVCVIVITINIS